MLDGVELLGGVSDDGLAKETRPSTNGGGAKEAEFCFIYFEAAVSAELELDILGGKGVENFS